MIYSILARRKYIVWVGSALVLFVASISLFRINIVNNALIFLPDSEGGLKNAARFLSESPAANMLFVDVEGDNPAMAAEIIESAVPESLAEPMSLGIRHVTPELLVRAFPIMFSEDARARLDKIDLDELMASNRAFLGGFGALAGSGWVQGDPLQLRQFLRENLPDNVPLFTGSTSPDGRHSLLMFKPRGSAFGTDASKRLIRILKEAAPAGYTLTMSGAAAHTAANSEAVEKDLFRIIIWSLLGFAAAYILLARSWGAVWILATAVASTLCAMSAVSFFWIMASGIAIGFGASLMGLAEDYAVHMHFALRSGTNQAEIYRGMLPPLFQSYLLNSSGFLVLLLSDIPAIRQMALFAVVSLMTGFLLAILVLPFLPGFPFPKNIHGKLKKTSGIPAYKRSIPACSILVILCFFLYDHLEYDFSPAALGASGKEIASGASKIRAIWNLEPAVNIVVEGASRDDALRQTAELAMRLRKMGAKDVIAASDLIFPGDQAVENIARWKKWLDERKLRENLLKAAARAGFGGDAFQPFLEALEQEPAPIKGPADLLVFGNSAIIRLQELPDTFNVDQENVHIFRAANLEAEISGRFSQEKRLIAIAALVLLILVALLLRNPRRILAISIPPLFSVVIIFSVYEALHMQFNLASLVALPIVFGLALDHGIMITHSLDRQEALGARRAIALASITAFFSIGLLALSDHPALRSMGLVIFSGLLGEFVAALWLVPLVYPVKGSKK